MNPRQSTVRLSIAFGMLIAILLGVGLLGLARMATISAKLQDIADRQWVKVKLSREALQYSELNRRITGQIFLMTDRNEMSPLLEQRAKNTDTISAILRDIETRTVTEEETAALARISRARTPYVNSYLKALDLLVKGNQPDQAREIMITTTVPLLQAYHQAYEDFVALQGRRMDLAGDAGKATYQAARRQVVGLIAIAMILAGAIATFVIRRMNTEMFRREEAQQELCKAQAVLEIRVRERTAELEHAQARLIETSRQAGMADIAAGVLHNVGNVLNGVTVSTQAIRDTLEVSQLGNLGRAVAMIDEHRDHLAEFLSSDEKGRRLPGFLGKLAATLAKEHQSVNEELGNLGKSIEHIQQIVTSQQQYAKPHVAEEPLDLREVVEDALRINLPSFARHGLKVIRDFSEVPLVMADKHLVIQILVNLVTNAKHAVMNCERESRQITLSVSTHERDGAEFVRVTIADSGIGITPENLSKVFSFGFTTKKEGHGFGLHSSANAAAQMRGTLTAHSDGPGRGAEFRLELPVRRSATSAREAA